MSLPLRVLLKRSYQRKQNINQNNDINNLFLSEILLRQNLIPSLISTIRVRLSMNISQRKTNVNWINEVASKDSDVNHSFPTTQPSRCLWVNDDIHTRDIAIVFRRIVSNFINVLMLLNFVNLKSLHVLLSFFLFLVQLLNQPICFSFSVLDFFSELFPILSSSNFGLLMLHLSIFVICTSMNFLTINTKLFFSLRTFLFNAWAQFLYQTMLSLSRRRY